MRGALRFVWDVFQLDRTCRRPLAYIHELQQYRLKKLLQFAVQRSPFYRQHLQGIDLDHCRLSDLPVLTKNDMMEHFDAIVTDPQITRTGVERFMHDPANKGQLYLGKYAICHTSGSQGQPALTVQKFKHLLLAFAAQVSRGMKRFRDPLIIGLRSLWSPIRVAVVTQRPGFYPSGAMFSYLATAGLPFQRLLRLSVFDLAGKLVSTLNEFQPNHLIAYGSSLELLAREEQAGRLQLRRSGALEQITSISESLPPICREKIEAIFGVHVSDQYALGECMGLSSGCLRESGSHLNADLACLEVVDDEYRPVPEGVAGSKVLITNLYNDTQPLIRYEVGDVVTMAAEPCSCGSNMPHIQSVVGRTTEKLWIEVNGEVREFPYYVFLHALNQSLEVAEHQVVQTAFNRFLVRVAPQPGKTVRLENVKELIDKSIADEGLAGLLDVQIEIVPDLGPDSRTGKRVRVLSHMNPPMPARQFTAAAAADRLEAPKTRA